MTLTEALQAFMEGKKIEIRGTTHLSFRPGVWAVAHSFKQMTYPTLPGRVVAVVQFKDGTIDMWPVALEPNLYEFRLSEARS